MRQRFFFNATGEAIRKLTGAIDDFSSALIAIKNMRCQVQGVLSECPGYTEPQFNVRYSAIIGFRWKNFRKVFKDDPYEKQVKSFSRYLLFSTCALYDAWIEQLVAERVLPRRLTKSLQFPGEEFRLKSFVLGNTAAIVSNVFYPYYKKNKKYYYAGIIPLLHCYRVFKEMRNCIIHAGGKASKDFVKAQRAYLHVCTTKSLGQPTLPMGARLSEGDDLNPTYSEVFGFTDVVIRLLASFDAELARTKNGQAYFLRQYMLKTPITMTFSSKPHKLEHQLKGSVRSAGFDFDVPISPLQTFLRSHGYLC